VDRSFGGAIGHQGEGHQKREHDDHPWLPSLCHVRPMTAIIVAVCQAAGLPWENSTLIDPSINLRPAVKI
jgi:hypothetical protein